MRGGLDDALDKLARRDELRRRTAAEATSTPPAVQDLVEAIASVVGRNPALAVTVGVEGAGDPMLLHFTVENGIVQVTADNTVASRVAETAPMWPRHADVDIDADQPVEEYSYPAASPHGSPSESGQATHRGYDQPGAEYATGPYRSPPPDHFRGASSDPHDATQAYPSEGRSPQASRGMPAPLPEPIPLKVDTAETEQAAKRLAALLRDDPTLLRRSSAD